MRELYGVKIVPLGDNPKEATLVSGAKMTHYKNLTTGEKQKIITWVDSVKIKGLRG